MRQNNEEYELGTVEVIVNKVEKTLTKVIFSDYLGTIEYTLTYGCLLYTSDAADE